MVREVVWTDPAWDDLEAAAEYIARDSVFYAAALVQETHEAASSLAEFAERGQIVPEFAVSMASLMTISFREKSHPTTVCGSFNQSIETLEPGFFLLRADDPPRRRFAVPGRLRLKEIPGVLVLLKLL